MDRRRTLGGQDTKSTATADQRQQAPTSGSGPGRIACEGHRDVGSHVLRRSTYGPCRQVRKPHQRNESWMAAIGPSSSSSGWPGEFPTALWHAPDGRTRRVTVWCSNDYLGMGQHPDVLAAMHRAIDRSAPEPEARATSPGPTGSMSNSKTELADLHGKEAALIFTSGWISNLAALGTLGRAHAGLRNLLGRAQPQFDDRRHPPVGRRAPYLPT